MSQPKSSCPNCGAGVEFRFSSSVQTTCEYCHSILVRTDVDVAKVGEVADLPLNSSPVQIGTEGIYGTKAFTVAGRIIYDYALGSWNEWHLVFQDGSSGWLSDAQLEYDVSFQVTPDGPIPDPGGLAPGTIVRYFNVDYQVTVETLARYRGVEGELPFTYWNKDEVYFIDIRTETGKFGTIDFSETPPLLFLGAPVEFEQLKLKNLREFEGWR